MMVTANRAFLDRYLDAWNAHDPAAVARHMADGAIYEDVALGRVLHGPSEIAKFVEEATKSSSDFRFEVVSLFTVGSNYANEWVMLGTNDRALPGVRPRPAAPSVFEGHQLVRQRPRRQGHAVCGLHDDPAALDRAVARLRPALRADTSHLRTPSRPE